MRILLWKIGALGDVIMTTPLVRQLRRFHPHAQIEFLVGRSSRAVLEGNPHIDRVVDFDERILFNAQAWRVREMLPLLKGYDEIYVLDKHWIFGFLARAAGIPRRIGFRRRAIEGCAHTSQVAYGALRHEIDCYLDLAEAGGVQIDRADRALELASGEPITAPPQYVVAINSGGANPGEASEVRKLPRRLFADLVQALAARNRVVFLGSLQELATYEGLAEAYGAVNLCGRTTLRQACYVLSQAQAVYTTDTGLMHMAGAVNTAVTAVFGPTHPLRKSPPDARWVWADEDRYDSRYELFGRVPRRRYFERLTVDNILDRAAPMQPLTAATGAERTSSEAPGVRG